MKRLLTPILTISLLLIFVFLPQPANAAGEVTTDIAEYTLSILDSGTCGDTVTWTLTEDYVLTISGTGEMKSYYSHGKDVPWYAYREQITAIVMEEGITKIGDAAFVGCSKITSITIPESVTTIGWGVFDGTSITSIHIPKNVTSIAVGSSTGWNYFSECAALETITVDAENTVFCAVDGLLYSKDQTTLYCCPTTREGDLSAFPEALTTINYCAFMNCTKLTSIQLPDTVITLGHGVFRNCSNLTSFDIPDGITSIGITMFLDCTALQSVSIPDSVTTIHSGAFSNCTSLETIEIPKGVTSIYYNSFNDCTAMTAFTVAAENETFCSVNGVLFSKDRAKLVRYPLARSGGYFVPVTVTSLEDSAFAGCTALTEIRIPSSVTSIYEAVFNGCTGLKTITCYGDYPLDPLFDEGGGWYGSYVFSDVEATVYYPENNDTWVSDKMLDFGGTLTYTAFDPYLSSGTCGENLTWTLLADGTFTVSGTGAMYDYPEVAGYYDRPWQSYRGNIQRLILEEGVTTVGINTFTYCYNLKQVSLPDSLTSIGRWAFDSSGLTTITIPNGVTALTNSFQFCASLTEVFIPESVKSIGYYTFSGCSSLEAVYIDSNIGDVAISQYFESTQNNVLTFPDQALIIYKDATVGSAKTDLIWTLTTEGTLTISGKGTMADYTDTAAPWSAYADSVTNLVLEEGCKSVGAYAFQNFTTISAVSIPETVTTVGDSAFSGCTALSTVSYAGNDVSWSQITIGQENQPLLNAIITYGKAHTHVFTMPSDILVQAADCENSALYYAMCDYCGEVSDSVTVSAGEPLGHTFSDWTGTAPTYTQAGNQSRTCGTCGLIQEETLPATGQTVADAIGKELEGNTLTLTEVPEDVLVMAAAYQDGKMVYVTLLNAASDTRTATLPDDLSYDELYLFFVTGVYLPIAESVSVK